MASTDYKSVESDDSKLSPKYARYIFLIIFCIIVLTSPKRYANNEVILEIRSGDTLSEIASNLDQAGVINSSFQFSTYALVAGVGDELKAGQYLFNGWNTVLSVLHRISNAKYGIPEISITVPEGLSNKELSKILINKLPLISSEEFIKSAASKEGYLFPDTYNIYTNATSGAVINRMTQEFDTKIKDYLPEIKQSRHTLAQIVTMASLLEKEASNTEDRKYISGILWKRISIGMPLQVDAVFPYIIGKNTYELSLDDLKTESPYNTYIFKGLPPGPINNPSLDSILAAIRPTKSKYLYYLSDKEGKMHYAENFEQHKLNKAKYLK